MKNKKTEFGAKHHGSELMHTRSLKLNYNYNTKLSKGSVRIQIPKTVPIVNDTYEIRSIDSRHCGRAHDASIWQLSDAREYISRKIVRNSHLWLLGDSGYPLEPWLLVPFRNPETLGLVKGRWRCMKLERSLHYGPEKVSKMVNCCAELHDFCLRMNQHRYLTESLGGDAVIDENECEIVQNEMFHLSESRR
ncbi:putative nuclease HARBI1 [Planococcus citri]|uniref:putative nuclease HARBI1 n=1 Tax=Planococcus citri TaxID=170843 RepID=UPI0031F88D77